MGNLTDLKAKNIKPGDKNIPDGTVVGLRLIPGKVKGHGKWSLLFTSPETHKRRDMGLGTYPSVSITEVRKAALAARELIRNRADPIEVRNTAKASRKADAQDFTFEQAAYNAYQSLKPGWTNAKHTVEWFNSLKRFVFPKLGKREVKGLKASDFADVLSIIWIDKSDTASRVKQRCSVVMDWCVAQEICDSNPVGVVGKLLPKQQSKRDRVVHQPSMAWSDIPAFVDEVIHNGKTSLSKLMLEFLILTAARSSEVRGLTWDEVDLAKAVWTVPANRMKTKVKHRVPLSVRAIEILIAQQSKNDHPNLVFPSIGGKTPSDMIITKLLRDHKIISSEAGRIATAHGFRSSFRNWASENGYPRDLAERSLSHLIISETERAYHRTDLLNQRRYMMEKWSEFVCGTEGKSNKVVRLSRRGSNA
jgi:integrase